MRAGVLAASPFAAFFAESGEQLAAERAQHGDRSGDDRRAHDVALGIGSDRLEADLELLRRHAPTELDGQCARERLVSAGGALEDRLGLDRQTLTCELERPRRPPPRGAEPVSEARRDSDGLVSRRKADEADLDARRRLLPRLVRREARDARDIEARGLSPFQAVSSASRSPVSGTCAWSVPTGVLR
jgi:hypothetical protein